MERKETYHCFFFCGGLGGIAISSVIHYYEMLIILQLIEKRSEYRCTTTKKIVTVNRNGNGSGRRVIS
jgi:hypothetical protein